MFTAAGRREMQGVAETLAKLDRDANEKIRLLLEAVGVKTIEYLRSFTAERRPPYRRGGPDRPAHPGHWADRKGQLAANYRYEVQATGAGWVLVFMNDTEYAAVLEAREQFWVLSGVTEPGGPVETALRAVLPSIAPGWQLRVYGGGMGA